MKSEIVVTLLTADNSSGLAGRMQKGDGSAWRDRIGQYRPLQRRLPVADIASEPENVIGESQWHKML